MNTASEKYDQNDFNVFVVSEFIKTIMSPLQGAGAILSKLRDSVQKEDWEPVLNQLLIQEPFQVRNIAVTLLSI